MLSSSNKSYIKGISEYAKNLGILFQIRDDLLDYSDSSDIGKPSYQDLKEGKVTYPFYYAYKNANKEEQRRLKNILGTKKLNKSKANKLVSRLNGIKETKKLAEKYYIQSIKCAKNINKLSVRQEMIELSDMALKRKK